MGQENALAFSPFYCFFKLAYVVVQRCVCQCFFKLVASTNYSPDNKKKTTPGTDKEVKGKKPAFISFTNLFMTLYLAGCSLNVFLSVVFYYQRMAAFNSFIARTITGQLEIRV